MTRPPSVIASPLDLDDDLWPREFGGYESIDEEHEATDNRDLLPQSSDLGIRPDKTKPYC